MFNNHKPLVNEVSDRNAQGSQLRNICIIVLFLFYGGWNGQNCCQIKLGNKTMSCNSTHFLLLYGSLIKLLILSMSSVWKKEVDIVSAYHECDCTCSVHANVHTLENNKKYTGIVFKEISEFHISSNLLVPPKLSLTLNLTSRHWESILSKILSLHRA